MSRHILLVAALLAGTGFYLIARTPDAAWWVAWKGAGVALLAAWAATQARDGAGWMLAAMLGCGALGDVLLETSGLTIGAVAFLAGHVLAIGLYLSHPRIPTGNAIVVAACAACAVSGVAFALSHDHGVTFYALGLGAMAGSALASRFPRPLVGLGAALFVVSDLLIFARAGPLAGSAVPRPLIWPFYFAGQALIAVGVARGLRRGRCATI